jgi:hypothetical protein
MQSTFIYARFMHGLCKNLVTSDREPWIVMTIDCVILSDDAGGDEYAHRSLDAAKAIAAALLLLPTSI